MRRKLVQQGPTTLMVSLPSGWVKTNNLMKGEEIELIEEGNNILIKADQKPEQKVINLTLKSSHYEYIRALMRNLYSHGFEVIHITYNTELDYTSISKAIIGLDGFEITKESKERCTIEAISDIKYEQFKTFYEKQYQIIQFMQELLYNGLKNKTNKTDKAIVENLNEKASKYACMCRRNLTKNKLMNNDNALITFDVITLIHMIARTYTDCYHYADKEKIKANEDILYFLKETFVLFNNLHELYLKKKIGTLIITEKRRELITHTLATFLSKKTNKNMMIFHYLGEIVRLIGTIAPKLELINNLLKNESIESY